VNSLLRKEIEDDPIAHLDVLFLPMFHCWPAVRYSRPLTAYTPARRRPQQMPGNADPLPGTAPPRFLTSVRATRHTERSCAPITDSLFAISGASLSSSQFAYRWINSPRICFLRNDSPDRRPETGRVFVDGRFMALNAFSQRKPGIYGDTVQFGVIVGQFAHWMSHGFSLRRVSCPRSVLRFVPKPGFFFKLTL
jgi:hypothetical protein